MAARRFALLALAVLLVPSALGSTGSNVRALLGDEGPLADVHAVPSQASENGVYWIQGGSAEQSDFPEHSARTADFGPLESSVIRPGVLIDSLDTGCTSNFVFVGADGQVYLGVAAHCFSTLDSPCAGPLEHYSAPGAFARIWTMEHEPVDTTLAYNSWHAATERWSSDVYACTYDDFALVVVPPVWVARTNPTVIAIGGPTGLADADDLRPGAWIHTYGQSALREVPGQPPSDVGDARSCQATHSDQMYVEFRCAASPVVFGDSGSPIVDDRGHALGIVTNLLGTRGGLSFGTRLDVALLSLQSYGGPEVGLAFGSSFTAPGIVDPNLV